MGFFDLFKSKENNKKNNSFSPNFNKTEYDNWLDYIASGGSTEEWNNLVKDNNWKFKKDKLKDFQYYQKELRPVFDKYLELTSQIKSDWPILIHTKDYKSKLSDKIENNCLIAIKLYEKVQEIDRKHNQEPMTGSPVFSKLALLYERRGEYEKAINVCKKAYEFRIDETARMQKLIKKAGRKATEDERKIISDDNLLKKPSRQYNNIDKKRQNDIDKNQQTSASKEYCDKVYSKYYYDYPIKPYISKDREVRTKWLEQSEMFPELSIIPKNTMVRYLDGLLPGHVYMLYWIKNVNRKRIPTYFEYKYGIQFSKEKEFLTDNGYLKNGKLTEKGERAIELHKEVIENH
ncbi:MAG: tetratricopeptide repeat protein [Thomasclavelia sp.]